MRAAPEVKAQPFHMCVYLGDAILYGCFVSKTHELLSRLTMAEYIIRRLGYTRSFCLST